MELLVIVVVALLYAVFHHKHYRRDGFGVWYSLRGPWHTRVTVSKRL